MIVILALSYYGMAELSRHIAATPQSITPVWPPEGIATAAVLVFGYQLLPGVLLGSFLANIWAFFDDRSLMMSIGSILQVVMIAIGTTIGVAFSKYLFQRTIYRRNPFVRINDTYRFLLLSAALAPVINATVGVSVLCLGSRVSWELFGENWLTWWISNVAGICIFTPALLSWYQLYRNNIFSINIHRNHNINHRHRLFKNSSRVSKGLAIFKRLLEAFILISAMVFVSWQSFYGKYDFEYILIPCLVWSVFRFGQLLSTNLIVVLTMIAVSGTVRGLGKFGSEYNSHHSLLFLQSFIVIIIVTTLSLVAILAEKQEAIASLKRSKSRLTDKSNQLEISKSNLSETAIKLEKQNLDLIESQKIAEQANQSKSDFLTNMSHELRTPLNAILCLSQMLQESPHISPPEKSDLHTIYQSSAHLLYLIEDILNISKIEAGGIDINLRSTCLSAFIHDVVKIAQVQAQQKNIEFVYTASSDLPEYVEIDDYRLRQILLNLLSNAIKFTEKGGVALRITCGNFQNFDQGNLNADRQDDMDLAQNPNQNIDQNSAQKVKIPVCFEVQDSGIGIRAEDLETIFLPFQQVSDRKFKSQGNGLGLSISQKIAEMMGSKIIVISEYGTGSIFRLSLDLQVTKPFCALNRSIEQEKNSYESIPQIDQSTRNESKSRNQSLTPLSAQILPLQDLSKKMPLRILLAEDNEVNQKVAKRLLHRMGYEVDIANNGVKALEMLQENLYDVVLMDIQMPEMNGIEATQQILQYFNLYRRPYIIAVTANAMVSDRQTCLNAGMDDYVSKPISLNLLAEALWRSQHGSC